MEFYLFNSLGRQNRAIYTTSSYIIAVSVRTLNRLGRILILATKIA